MTRWWRSHSVRVRLTIWYVAAMVVVLAVYSVLVYAFVRRSMLDALDQRLRDDFFWASAILDDAPDGRITWTPPPVDLLLVQDQMLPSVQVWSADGGELLLRTDEARLRPLPEGQALARSGDDRTLSVPAADATMRVLTRRGSIGERPVVVQVWRSEAGMRGELRNLVLTLMLGLPVAVAAAGLGGYALARRALEPVERMTDRARSITASNLHDRLPVVNPDDEMGRLASVFNETLGRLEASFEQMRRFTADVSHELRTPLTAIRSVGEVGLRGHRDAAAYRAIIGSMLEEADRLASLVDRLLALSRAETGQAILTREVVDLRELAENVAAHLGVLAEEKRQSISVECTGRPAALTDRLVLRQAFINLVDNAIKFSPPGGRILVRLFEAGPDACVEVVDSGRGVPAEAQAHLFDRFYRADDAVGGTGLGLSIARGAVEALGGRLTLEETGPAGSRFRISVPRAAEAARRAV